MSTLLKKRSLNKLDFLFISKLNFLLLNSGRQNVSGKLLVSIIKNFKNNNKKLNNRDFLIFFEKVLNNILCRFIIKKRSKGKLSQDIPIPIYNNDMLYSSTIRNLLKILRKNKESNTKLLYIGIGIS
jgi:hypothetical protein